jgi:type II secretory pathway pseudopilin PulG
MRMDCTESTRGMEMEQSEQGFMLVGLIVAIFLVLLALSVAAPKVAQELRREREVEAVHRGNQYVRAIRLFYKKTGTYPGSMEQLEKTNNTRYLRQRYVDPMTGKADWRLIKVGEAKTTVKGFFGQPLAGMAQGLGSAAGMGSAGAIGAGAAGQQSSGSAFGGSSSGGYGSSSPGGGGLGSSSMPTLGGTTTGGTTSGSTTSGSATLGSDSPGSGTTNSLGSASGIASSQTGSGMPGGGGPFVGVGVPKEGDSITILNEQTTYNTWEFIYDPRIEQLYAKGALFGGGASGLGSAAGNSSGFGNAPTTPGFGGTPGSGTSGFGNTSGFGSTPGSGSSGFGSTPGTSSPTPPTTPPQQQPQ